MNDSEIEAYQIAAQEAQAGRIAAEAARIRRMLVADERRTLLWLAEVTLNSHRDDTETSDGE